MEFQAVFPAKTQVRTHANMFSVECALSIKMRAAEEMDQADLELRTTIIKVWPYEGKEKIDLLVPPREGIQGDHSGCS